MTTDELLARQVQAAAEAMPAAPVEVDRVLKRARRLSLLHLASVILLAIAAVVLLSFGGVQAKNAINAEVPDVTGMSLEEAKAELRKEGLVAVVSGRCEGPATCEVARQTPKGHTTAEPSSEVALVIRVRVPDVRRERMEDARRQLEEVGLKMVDADVERRGCWRQQCYVHSQRPGALRYVGNGAEVRVTRATRVPEVDGVSSVGAAQALLGSAGLELERPSRSCPPAAQCRLTAQEPRAGQIVQVGSLVRVDLAVEVPDVINADEEQAQDRVRRAGLRPFAGGCSPRSRCTVHSTRPRRGVLHPIGADVVLELRPGAVGRTSVAVPRLLGLQVGSAEAALRERGLRPRSRTACPPGARCFVVDQLPGHGERAARGRRVDLVLGAAVPHAVGEQLDVAATVLERSGFVADGTRPCPVDLKAECLVARQVPRGSVERLGSAVTLVPGVLVPSLDHLRHEEALESLRDRHLVPEVEPDADCRDEDSCVVVDQSHASGTVVPFFTAVRLRTAVLLRVPDVSARNAAAAREVLERADLRPELVDEEVCAERRQDAPRLEDRRCTVASQDPPARAYVPRRAEVRLVLEWEGGEGPEAGARTTTR